MNKTITPSSRLLIWVAVVVLPAAAVAGLLPAFAPVALAAVILLMLMAALDAALGLGVLEGIAVRLPALTRFHKDREDRIEIQITNERQKGRRLRLGLALPGEFTSPQEELTIDLPAEAATSRVEWPCTGTRRGSYALDRCFVESASPLGFWAARTALPARGELRVFPDLIHERNRVASVFLNRGGGGMHAQRQIGKGRDFEQLRDYLPGDSYEDVHWKATAKRGRPVTKMFQIERTQEVYVVIDASRLSARPAPGAGTILERFITAGLVLGMAAEQQGDLFGLLTFSDRIENFTRAKTGPAHFNHCRDSIYALHPREVTPDFDELSAFIRLRLRRRALLIILTSLDDPVLAENFTRAMELVSRQHVVVVNMMQAPEVGPMFSGAPAVSVEDMYQRLGGHVRWHRLRELGKNLERRGVRFTLVANERLTAELISQYMCVKRRQVL